MNKWVISFLLGALAAFLLYIPVRFLHIEYNEQLYQDTRNQASNHLNSIRDDIQSQLDSSLFYADFFEMIVSQNPGITESELREYGAFVVERNPLVDSISLVKDGIIHFIYPLKGNEPAVGYNLIEESETRLILEEAVSERTAIVQGPVEAVQGGNKLINYKPVFVETISREEVWGFANVTIDFDYLIDSGLSERQSPDYEYAIKMAARVEDPVIVGSEAVFDSDAVTASIDLPKNNWTIALVPSEGWNRNERIHNVQTLVFYIFILIIFKLVTFFVHQYYTKRDLSRTDALTRLLNKKTFELTVKRALRQSTRKNGLLLIDFNDFKSINDTYGHPVGDDVLTITADRLTHCLKKGDIIGRIGGDEIMILARGVEAEEELVRIKDRVIQHIEEPIVLEDKTIHPSLSVGYTLVDHSLPFDELYNIVDQNMYTHKLAKKSVNSLSFKQADFES